jgi:hypothetical protein
MLVKWFCHAQWILPMGQVEVTTTNEPSADLPTYEQDDHTNITESVNL